MKKIAIAVFMQESNTFSPAPAQREEFQILCGEAVAERFAHTNSEAGGFLKACAERGWTPVPAYSATATSGGPLSSDCFESITAELVNALLEAKADGILLALHGAMSTEKFPSGDAEICRRLRAAVGPDLPIVVSHDLHANVTGELLEAVDGIAGYRTYPHVDQEETALRAATLLDRILKGEHATNWQIRVPMLIPPHAGSTFEAPLLPVLNRMCELFPEDAAACVSPFFVQPWLDLKPMSGCFTVTSFGKEAAVAYRLRELAQLLWDLRRDFLVDWVAPEELADRIGAASGRPILLSEAHDSPSGGSTGDHTGLLAALLPYAGDYDSCLFLIDREAAAEAIRAGVGAKVNLRIGAKLDSRYCEPAEVQATVESVSDGEFTFRGPAFHGLRQSIGPTAVLAVARMRIVLGTRAVYVIDPELFRSQGVDPAAMDLVGIKSPTLFRAAYDSISKTILYLDMPGVCRGKFQAMPFQDIERPIYPLDDFEWSSESTAVHFWKSKINESA